MVSIILSYLTGSDVAVLLATGFLVPAATLSAWSRFNASFWWPTCIAAGLCGLVGVWVSSSALIEVDRDQAAIVFAFGLSSVWAAFRFMGSFLLASAIIWGPPFVIVAAVFWRNKTVRLEEAKRRYLEGKG